MANGSLWISQLRSSSWGSPLGFVRHCAACSFVILVQFFLWTVNSQGADFERDIRPLLTKHCIGCHSTQKQEGELDLERFTSIDSITKEPTIWLRTLEQLQDNEMPPKDQPQLSEKDKRLLLAWNQEVLDAIALASAGDPGPVVLRRLSNAEYTYTLRDLTGVDALDPAREFPADGAAGEGFTNAASALSMSPSLLTKYLDAAKEVSQHAVLLPDSIRFSNSTSARDWADESLLRIRQFYSVFTDATEGTAVDLQGIKFVTNSEGRLPVAKYLKAIHEERVALISKKKDVQQVARERGLNAKYLGLLQESLMAPTPSLILAGLQKKWNDGSLAEEDVRKWQDALWRFTSVGHIGKTGGATAWMEPVDPLASQQEVKMKIPAAAPGQDVLLYLVSSDAGDGNSHDVAIWENPRIVLPNRQEIPLRDIREILGRRQWQLNRSMAFAAQSLAAADELDRSSGPIALEQLAQKHQVPMEVLQGWLQLLGIGAQAETSVEGRLTGRMERSPDYDFIRGWTGENALSVLANSSANTVRVPGLMKPNSVAVHPSPSQSVVVLWRSPVGGNLRIEGLVQHAHAECGNGIGWNLEVRRGKVRRTLASGRSQGATPMPVGPFENVRVRPGDAIALSISPLDNNHSCDLTAVDFTLSDGTSRWDLASDVSPDILKSNPHPGRVGSEGVWHFLGEPVSSNSVRGVPPGSLLDLWNDAQDATKRAQLATQIQSLLQSKLNSAAENSPDNKLYEWTRSWDSPFAANSIVVNPNAPDESLSEETAASQAYGLEPALFGKLPSGESIAPKSLGVQAPSVLELRLPSSLAQGAELVATTRLHADQGREGSVQTRVQANKPAETSDLTPSQVSTVPSQGAWTDSSPIFVQAPILVNEGSESAIRFKSAFDSFRQLFPTALCYSKIVPVDEVVTLTLFHREDDHLVRLMLNDQQKQELDRMWDELRFVSQDALMLVDAFEQIWQYSTQDGPDAPHGDKRLEPLREPIMQKAAAFKLWQVQAEPAQIQGVLEFAAKAWRRPLRASEENELKEMYRKLRGNELSHVDTIRSLLSRVLVSSSFLYRCELPSQQTKVSSINDWELAARLSYFLWSSAPDEPLRRLASEGKLTDPEVLSAEMKRMLRDPKVRRLATEFGCQWLQVRDVESLDEKSERHFPTFVSLRGAMQEETVRVFMDLFENDRAVISLLDSDHSFINEGLAKHYELAQQVTSWQRVDGLRASGRGGILGLASTLAKQSGASRTSPILRGAWLSEVILGEKLPKPPKDVPILPEEAPAGLSERELIERHSSDAKCAVCHERIDPFGFALESFDAIGRHRTVDAAGKAINTDTRLKNGTEIDGLNGLRDYLVRERSEDFREQFCRKLLGYALGRGVQLSDAPLIKSILEKTRGDNDHVQAVVEAIVLSSQFREVRGLSFVPSNE